MDSTSLSGVIAVIVAFGPVIYWLVDLVKDLKNGDANGSVTKILAVIIAFGVVNLYAHSGTNLGGSGNFIASLNWCALLLASLVFAATGGLINDHLRARNAADTTVKSKLLP